MTNQGVSQACALPVPIGGLNSRDPLSAMDPSDAITLENWFPDLGSVILRSGYTTFSSISGGSSPVNTLVEFLAANGNRFLVGCSNNKIYDFSSSTASDITGAATISETRWQATNFRSSGGTSYLILVNGTDNCLYWTGSGNVALAVYSGGSGPTNDNVLIHVNVFKSRLYFVEKDTFKVWYGATGQATGSLAGSYDFAPFFKRGGYLLWTATWTYDSKSAGLSDYFIACSSVGEILVYAGSDPTDWSLIGKVYLPPPLGTSSASTNVKLGRRSYFYLDADLLIITQEGVIKMSDAFQYVDPSITYRKFTDKIQLSFNTSAQTYSTNFGWEGIVCPKYHFALVNIPVTQDSKAIQYVINTLTGSWTKFTGWNAQCFSLYKDNIYFGGTDGKVYKAWSGADDNGNKISTKLQTAFNFCEDTEHIKRFLEVRPVMSTSGSFSATFGIDVDFRFKVLTNTTSMAGTIGSDWETSSWDTSDWAADVDTTIDYWVGVDGIGRAASIKMLGDYSGLTVNFNAFHIKYESGGIN